MSLGNATRMMSQTVLIIIAAGFCHCSNPANTEPQVRLVVSYNPYAGVDWTTWQRCLSQHHDHTNVEEAKIRDYDGAGYQAIPLLHYSGVKSLTYTRKERLWPLSKFLKKYPSDEAFLSTLQNAKFFIPSMEEVGRHHMTSPFLLDYLELYEPHLDSQWQPWQYRSNQELIDLIAQHRGLALIAHPTESFDLYQSLSGFHGLEVYSAAMNYNFITGKIGQNKNAHFIRVWDDLLSKKSTRIFGYAVNDWYGPFNREVRETHPRIYDSGKTLALLENYSLEAYRRSLEQGSFFAIMDTGMVKGNCPQIQEITASPDSISISAVNGNVHWIFKGEVMQSGSTLSLDNLPSGMNYVRAEVRNENCTVFVQPFTLSPATRE